MARVASPRGKLLTTRQAAEYLGVHPSFVRRLLAARKVASLRDDNGRLIGIYEADLDAWQDAHRREAEGQRSPREVTDIDRLVAQLPGAGMFS